MADDFYTSDSPIEDETEISPDDLLEKSRPQTRPNPLPDDNQSPPPFNDKNVDSNPTDDTDVDPTEKYQNGQA